MDQLTINDILDLCARLRQKGMTMEEIKALPIYLGDDDELNGIHTGWGLDFVDSNNTTDEDEWMVEMINENRCNIKLDGKAVVIS
jgi:hypothetical protein